MSITKEKKAAVIEEFRRDEKDTGSAEVQIAVLTNRINALTEHMKANKKDHASRRGLLMLVSKRRSLLNYIHRTQPETYRSLLERLSLRR
ncbi:MAG: 30S ribosomal protein S15 [Planctomycetota bacterium]